MSHVRTEHAPWFMGGMLAVAVAGSLMAAWTVQRGGFSMLPGFSGAMPSSPMEPGLPLAVDLGDGAQMEFVWVQVLGGWVGKYEVSNEQYRRFRPKHDSGTYRGHSLNADAQPVANVPYADGIEGAIPFADWLTKRLHERGRLPPGYAFRMPTSAEWQTLATCGDDRTYPWGNSWPPVRGNFADQAARELFDEDRVLAGYSDGFTVACPVEESGANEWGIHGLAGNVWEWTLGEGGPGRPLRGGSWLDRSEEYLRCDSGYAIPPTYRFDSLGFRLMLMPEEGQEPPANDASASL